MKCFRKTVCQTGLKLLPNKITRFLSKKINPSVDIIKKRTRTNAVTPSSCNYDVIESVEADFLDLHFKFHDETADNEANEQLESYENEKNEEIERVILQRKLSKCRRTFPTGATVFCQTRWAPSPDSDICCRGDIWVTHGQRPNEQIPRSELVF
ncbi:hypothetical protein RUM43_003821 [Polyplax serrata]|uniref:Uncharacterized protein n=1 Tax=Polyplax serrata TaxID=468196 RepID=A0AAN8NXF6_POLSC